MLFGDQFSICRSLWDSFQAELAELAEAERQSKIKAFLKTEKNIAGNSNNIMKKGGKL